jgi:hypothetical protein
VAPCQFWMLGESNNAVAKINRQYLPAKEVQPQQSIYTCTRRQCVGEDRQCGSRMTKCHESIQAHSRGKLHSASRGNLNAIWGQSRVVTH